MNEQETAIINDFAQEAHEGYKAVTEELEATGFEGFKSVMSMDDLYEADKLGFALYVLIADGAKNHLSGWPVSVQVSDVVKTFEASGVHLTPEQVEDKIRELSGMVVVQDFGPGVMAFPVLSVITTVKVGGETFYLFGGHGLFGASITGYAVAMAAVVGEGSR